MAHHAKTRYALASGVQRTVLFIATLALGACADSPTATHPVTALTFPLASASMSSPQVLRVRSRHVKRIPAPRLTGEIVRGEAAEAKVRASLLEAIHGGPKTDAAFKVWTVGDDGRPQALTASQFMAILTAEAGDKAPQRRSALSLLRWDPGAVAYDEEANAQTININPYNSVTAGSSSFNMFSRSTVSATGTPTSQLGPVEFKSVLHDGSYTISVGGAVIRTGHLTDSGTMPNSGGAYTSNWQSVDVGTYCTIDGSLSMDHSAYFKYQNTPDVDPVTLDPIPLEVRTRPGVGSGQMSHPCDDDTDQLDDNSYCDDPSSGCDHGDSGGSRPATGGIESIVTFDAPSGPSGTLMCDAVDWYVRSCQGETCTEWEYVGTEFTNCHYV